MADASNSTRQQSRAAENQADHGRAPRASQPLTEQDQRVLTMVIEAGRALVLAFNKWDLVDEDRRYLLDREIDRELAQLQLRRGPDDVAEARRGERRLRRHRLDDRLDGGGDRADGAHRLSLE